MDSNRDTRFVCMRHRDCEAHTCQLGPRDHPGVRCLQRLGDPAIRTSKSVSKGKLLLNHEPPYGEKKRCIVSIGLRDHLHGLKDIVSRDHRGRNLAQLRTRTTSQLQKRQTYFPDAGVGQPCTMAQYCRKGEGENEKKGGGGGSRVGGKDEIIAGVSEASNEKDRLCVSRPLSTESAVQLLHTEHVMADPPQINILPFHDGLPLHLLFGRAQTPTKNRHRPLPTSLNPMHAPAVCSAT